MPKIFEYFGFIFLFYSNEHEPIHVHVMKDEHEAIFEIILENGELVGTPLPLQGVADEVVEVEGDGKQENVSAGGGDKDKGNDPPDLPL